MAVQPLISAHRCGAGNYKELENTLEALQYAISLDVEFVEFDVQRCIDGSLVLYHDDCIEYKGEFKKLAELTFEQFAQADPKFLHYEDALNVLKIAQKKAHIDIKFVSLDQLYDANETSYEVEATMLALEKLGEGQFIITSLEDQSVRSVRDWADSMNLKLLVGLSLGRALGGRTPWEMLAIRYSELFPSRRFRQSGANLMVAQRKFARIKLAHWARKKNIPLLVWTVDDDRELQKWLKDSRVWMITSNYPAKVVTFRKQHLSRTA